MGFLIFSLRKQQLIRNISRGQLKSMLLGLKLQNIQAKISDFQEKMSNYQSIFDNMTGNALMNAQNMYQMRNMGMYNNPELAQIQKDYQNEKDESKKKDLYMQYQQAQSQASQYMQFASAEFSAAQQKISYAKQGMQSIFESQQKQQLTSLQREETKIQQQQAQNDTQLSMWTEERKNVEKQEAEEIKNSAPKFGLA